MTLLETSDVNEARIIGRVGLATILMVVLGIVAVVAVRQFSGEPKDVLSLTIRVPFAGQGVGPETPVIMHGVKIGEVADVSNMSSGGVQLDVDLQQVPALGLTTEMSIDYRPSNYFGVTGVNIIPASGGTALSNGMQLDLAPKGNYSLQALLYRLGEITNGVLDARLISVIDRSTQYIEAFRPLLETLLIVTGTVAEVQNVSTEQLLRNATGISVAFPGTIDALISSGKHFVHNNFGDGHNPDTAEKVRSQFKFWPTMDEKRHQQYYEHEQLWFESMMNDQYNVRVWDTILDKAKSDLFAKIGDLEYSHVDDLFPLTESIRGLADVAPRVIDPEELGVTMRELRSRFERMYAESGDLHALPVRIVIDKVPGVASAIGYGVGVGAP